MKLGNMWISNYTDSKEMELVVKDSDTCEAVHKKLLDYGLERIKFENCFVNEDYFITVYYFSTMYQVSVRIEKNKSKRTAEEYRDLFNFNKELANMTTYEMQTYGD